MHWWLLCVGCDQILNLLVCTQRQVLQVQLCPQRRINLVLRNPPGEVGVVVGCRCEFIEESDCEPAYSPVAPGLVCKTLLKQQYQNNVCW